MKKKILETVVVSIGFSIGIVGVFSNSAQAAPIKNLQTELKQPNGQIISCYASGDEFYNYYHDGASQLIIKNPRTGYYSYAKYTNDKVKPSQYKVENIKNQVITNIKENYVSIPKADIDKKRKEMEPVEEKVFNADNNKTLNNLTVFIKFNDQGDFSNKIDYYDKIFNNKTKGESSLYNYYNEVSYGKQLVETKFYPTQSGNKIVTYTDPNPRSYYVNYKASERALREQTLIKNAIEHIKDQIPADLDLDSNNDGKVDNICFVVEGQAEGWASMLWPHKWQLFNYNVRINNKKVDVYNMQFERHLNNVNQATSVLSHEMFHSLGAPDLYKYVDKKQIPVGMWDIMAHNMNPPQHMNMYMKNKYGKWIDDIPKIEKNGTYTIKDVTSPDDNAYIIKSPKSDTEYFVVEYRGAKGFDKALGGNTEGLIVYRINSKIKGNAGDGNEVYVIRENNNTFDSSKANLTQKGSRQAVGKDKNFLMTFTDGKNSGIKIDKVEIQNGKASFNVTFPDEKTSSFKAQFDTIKDGDIISGVKNVSGWVSYIKNIKNVKFIVDAKTKDAELSQQKDGKVGFNFDIDTSIFGNGKHSLTIIAEGTDGQNYTITEGLNFQINNEKKDDAKTAKEIADSITLVEQPTDYDTQIKIPKVPTGYAIKISDSSMQAAIDLTGRITRQNTLSNVAIKLEVTRLSDNTKAKTKQFNIVIKEKTQIRSSYFIHLEDLKATNTNIVWGSLRKNKSVDGNEITIRGNKYKYGLSIYSKGQVEYNLDGKYSRFTSDVGIDDEVKGKGSVIIEVYGDNSLLYSSGKITGKDAKKSINVNVSNVKSLKFVIKEDTTAHEYDNVSFGNPRLYGN